jgi:AhpC/TSA family protein
VCLAAHDSEFRRWPGGVDRRICQTFAASPAEPGELLLGFSVGDPAPDFSLPTAKAGTWRLAEHLAKDKFSSLVVVFYRGTWCGYCNIYLRGLLETRSLLSDANAALITVSPEAAAPVAFDDASAAGPTPD